MNNDQAQTDRTQRNSPRPGAHSVPVVIVSACLLGTPCRYDGASKPAEWLQKWHGKVLWLPVCPELLAGMGVPRPPIEHVRRKGRWRVELPDGTNVMPRLLRTVQRILPWCHRFGVQAALLKERSPSCGPTRVHVDGEIRPGRGVVAHHLFLAGYPLFSEADEARFQEWVSSLDTDDGKE